MTLVVGQQFVLQQCAVLCILELRVNQRVVADALHVACHVLAVYFIAWLCVVVVVVVYLLVFDVVEQREECVVDTFLCSILRCRLVCDDEFVVAVALVVIFGGDTITGVVDDASTGEIDALVGVSLLRGVNKNVARAEWSSGVCIVVVAINSLRCVR